MYVHTYVYSTTSVDAKAFHPSHLHASPCDVPPTHSRTSMTTDWKSFSGSADTKGNSSDKYPDTAQ